MSRAQSVQNAFAVLELPSVRPSSFLLLLSLLIETMRAPQTASQEEVKTRYKVSSSRRRLKFVQEIIFRKRNLLYCITQTRTQGTRTRLPSFRNLVARTMT